MMSKLAPAPSGTINVIGQLGKSCDCTALAAVSRHIAAMVRPEVIVGPNLIDAISADLHSIDFKPSDGAPMRPGSDAAQSRATAL